MTITPLSPIFLYHSTFQQSWFVRTVPHNQDQKWSRTRQWNDGNVLGECFLANHWAWPVKVCHTRTWGVIPRAFASVFLLSPPHKSPTPVFMFYVLFPLFLLIVKHRFLQPFNQKHIIKRLEICCFF